MLRVIKITESKLIKLIKNIITEESESDADYYDMDSEQYNRLLVSVGNQAHAIPKLPMFKGKKIRVVGNLDLRNKPIKSLGQIIVTGTLTIAGSQIKSLDGVEYGSLGQHYGTPYAQEIERRRAQKERSDANSRREDREWNPNDPNIDDEGLRANVAFQYMVSEGDIEELSYEEVEELKSLEKKLEELQDRIDIETDADVVDELTNDYDELQYDIDELRSKNNDVYELVYDGTHYEMDLYKSIEEATYGNKYAVGTIDEADKSLDDYYDDMVNDLSNFDRNTLSYYVDGEEVAEYLEDSVRDSIYDDPDGYGIGRDLSRNQEKEITELQVELFLLNYGIIPPLDFVVNRENNWEYTDGEGNKINFISNQGENNTVLLNGTPTLKNPVYKDIDWDEMSENISERIVDIEDEIETIKDNPDGDLDEDEVEKEVESRLEEIKDDPISILDDYGMSYDNFINIKQLKDDLVGDADYGVISHYNGTYDEITINGEDFIVFRVD
jgi:hypothetical protein